MLQQRDDIRFSGERDVDKDVLLVLLHDKDLTQREVKGKENSSGKAVPSHNNI